jgi:hypothetical protein
VPPLVLVPGSSSLPQAASTAPDAHKTIAKLISFI